MILEYYRVRDNAHPPTRANPSDAGLDVYYNPENPKVVELSPGDNAVLATGLRVGIPHGYMLQVMNRSSLAAKKSLVVGAHCIDSGYDGEIFIDVHNVGTENQVIVPHTKIAQLVMVPVIPFRAVESNKGDLYGWEPITISARGNGGFGSTGE